MKINLKITPKKEKEDFSRIADELMNNYILTVCNAEYRIAEIEFYLHSNSHPDHYVHKHELQKKYAAWFFHGSGMDITFGNGKDYGGILIRAIYNINNDEYIYGPLNTVRELFINFTNIYKSPIAFGLIHADQGKLDYKKPIAAPRVNLNPATDKDYYKALYRFLILPKKKHADKGKIYKSMLEQKYSKEEANNIWG